MKKNLLALAFFSLTAFFSGSAAESVSNIFNKENAQTISKNTDTVIADATAKTATRATTNFTIDDLYGYYKGDYEWFLKGQDPYGMNPLLSPGNASGSFILRNFPIGGSNIEGSFNSSTQQIVIKEQYLYTLDAGDVYFQIWDGYEEKWVKEITATIDSDGVITFQKGFAMCYHNPAAGDDDGYYYGVYDVVFTPVKAETFVYNPSEWTEYGTAMFADNCILGFGLFEEEDYDDLAIKVALYKHKTIPGDFLIMNPYIGLSPSSWGGFYMEDMIAIVLGNFSIDAWVREPGYLRFNVSDPDCVYVYPGVPSGVFTSMFDQFYIFNSEGQMIVSDGYSTDDVIEDYWQKGKDVSFYDFENGVAYIFNCHMGNTSEPLNNFNWFDDGVLRIKFNYDPFNDNVGNESTLKLTADGKTINDGDVINVYPHDILEYEDGGTNMYLLSWDAKIFASSTLGETDLTLTVNTNDNGFNICWPLNCKFVTPGTEFSTTDLIYSSPTDLQFHCTADFSESQIKKGGYLSAKCSATDQDGNSVSFTVNCQITDKAGVGAINNDNVISEIYDATGRRINSVSKGINIIKYSDGSIRKVLVK